MSISGARLTDRRGLETSRTAPGPVVGQPILFVLDENSTELEELEHDLSRRFEADYRVMVLLIDREYTSANPVVEAMTLGLIDHHLSKPWNPQGEERSPTSGGTERQKSDTSA